MNVGLANLSDDHEWTSDVVAGNCIAFNTSGYVLQGTISNSCVTNHPYRCFKIFGGS